jgi:hypothetical protein
MRFQFTIFFFFLCVVSANAQIENRKINDFHIIYVFGPFKVNLVKADSCGLKIDYDGLDQKDVSIKSKDGYLSIRLRSRSFIDFQDDSWERTHTRFTNVTIYYTTLEAIEARAGAAIRSSEVVAAKNLFLVSKMGAQVNLEVNTQKLELESSMGSEVDLRGVADRLKIRSKMGSDVNASALKSRQVIVSSSMGSDVSVYAEEELDASADFGASITYRGNPSLKHTSKFLGAEVNRRN